MSNIFYVIIIQKIFSTIRNNIVTKLYLILKYIIKLLTLIILTQVTLHLSNQQNMYIYEYSRW